MSEPTTPRRKPSWDEYFMAMAVLCATRATCERGRVGVVLVRDRRLLATGYNGPIGKNPDCLGVDRCRKTKDGGCAETAHAEQNAVAYAARYGVDLTGCTCYLSGYSPCLACAKLLIQCGGERVVFRQLYRDTMPLQFLEEAGIEWSEYDGPSPVIGWDSGVDVSPPSPTSRLLSRLSDEPVEPVVETAVEALPEPPSEGVQARLKRLRRLAPDEDEGESADGE